MQHTHAGVELTFIYCYIISRYCTLLWPPPPRPPEKCGPLVYPYLCSSNKALYLLDFNIRFLILLLHRIDMLCHFSHLHQCILLQEMVRGRVTRVCISVSPLQDLGPLEASGVYLDPIRKRPHHPKVIHVVHIITKLCSISLQITREAL